MTRRALSNLIIIMLLFNVFPTRATDESGLHVSTENVPLFHFNCDKCGGLGACLIIVFSCCCFFALLAVIGVFAVLGELGYVTWKSQDQDSLETNLEE